jgi:hypothetical protein
MTTQEKVQGRPAPVVLLGLGPGPHAFCPACGKQIHFIRTVAGKQMPCEMEGRVGDGRMTLVTREGKTVRKAPAEVYGWEPHWGYCTAPRSFGQLVCKGGAV